jgi:phenylacetate-coenzyme A ligase PaaK-like adenylate-forming protein
MEAVPRQGIFRIENDRTFRDTTLEVFRYQAAMNPVYREFIHGIGLDPKQVREPDQVPFLPVEFFRTHRVICGNVTPGLIFESSGTTRMEPSRHYVADPGLYQESFSRGFTSVYGDPSGLCILALLPSYLEREGSSLVYMMEHLIRMSGHPESGFYLDQGEKLAGVLGRCNRNGQPTLLIGVSFALLDLAEKYPMELGDHIVVMETGGMKGRRKELIREELHRILRKAFHSKVIHSEYGMTELLSQAYSTGKGIFRCPPWMKVLIREPNDPLSILSPLKVSQSGGINIIDLANLYSCAFIATGDLGVLHPDGSFEVRGRFDHADVRGCNLMVT